jgi:DNA gyrase inhibitor GyrI
VYEAVAQALRVFRENAWVDEIGTGLTAVTVLAKQPEVQHRVLMKDFNRWLESSGKTPAEVVMKRRLRQLLGR